MPSNATIIVYSARLVLYECHLFFAYWYWWCWCWCCVRICDEIISAIKNTCSKRVRRCFFLLTLSTSRAVCIGFWSSGDNHIHSVLHTVLFLGAHVPWLYQIDDVTRRKAMTSLLTVPCFSTVMWHLHRRLGQMLGANVYFASKRTRKNKLARLTKQTQ